MSRITLAPNASGTGTLTVAAPNTNTDRTLTLPDATTTLVGTDATQTLSNKTFSGTTIVPIIYTGNSAIDLALSAGTTFQTTGAALALRGSTAGYNTYGMEFYAGGSERMRIDASGKILAGTASTFDNVSFTLAQFLGGIATKIDNATAVTQVSFFNPNGRVGYIGTSGSATTYNTSSDYRLKENVQPMQNALDKIAQLNPVTYTWKADGSDGQGFIAHELQAVVPDCVTGEKDAVDADGKPQYQGVDTSFLVATLVKAIQELTARIAVLEAK